MTELLLVPLELPRADELLGWLAAELKAAFHIECRIDPGGFDMSATYDRARDQYDTRALLAALADHQNYGWVLGVTGRDLFLPIFTFVIGEAHLGGRTAVVSTYRLSELPPGIHPGRALLRERLLKEAVHEIGHCHGLLHCQNWRCVMHASSTAEDVDLKGDEPCDACLATLKAQRPAD